MTLPPLLDAGDVARLLKCSRRHALDVMHRAGAVVDGRMVRIEPAALADYIRSKREPCRDSTSEGTAQTGTSTSVEAPAAPPAAGTVARPRLALVSSNGRAMLRPTQPLTRPRLVSGVRDVALPRRAA